MVNTYWQHITLKLLFRFDTHCHIQIKDIQATIVLVIQDQSYLSLFPATETQEEDVECPSPPQLVEKSKLVDGPSLAQTEEVQRLMFTEDLAQNIN